MQKENKEKKKSGKKIAFIAILLSVFMVTGALAVSYSDIIMGALGLGSKSEALASTTIENKKYELLNLKATLYEDFDEEISLSDGNTVNILVFGMDRNTRRKNAYSIFRPDTIILATVNLNDLSIKLLSLPRDTYVPIHGRGGKDKINACFYYGSLGKSDEDAFEGGINCLKGTVSDLLGVPVNYYAGVDMDGVVGIIDKLGGVTTEVHDDIYSHDGEVMLKKGVQTLTGKQFLQYARCRQYAMGDIGRVDVQQRLLKELFRTATSSENITKLPKLVQEAFDMVITDITFDQATALAFTLMDFSSENIKTDTLPGTFGNLRKISYWIIRQAELRSFAKEWYGVSLPARTQDPTSDKLQKLTASPSSVSVAVGESATVSLKGSHADGKTRSHTVSSCSVSVGDSSVATVSGGKIVGVAPGSTTVKFTKSGKSVTVSVTVY
ncbi:MAG: hypothetical protein E7218_08925 [Anaerofustis stercorihominis]|nr:hypothetical protein [Anaerofustis stercorihominis]